jgi:altronate hydrolase
MTLEPKILRIDTRDNVAVALTDFRPGEAILHDGVRLQATAPISAGHKMALACIERGKPVTKYGHPIGTALDTIRPGDWVHTHNLASALSGIEEYPYAPKAYEMPAPAVTSFDFQGYLRKDGRAGIRNEIWIIVTVGCCNPVAETLVREAGAVFAGRSIDGVFHFPHPFGCSQLGGDLQNSQRILAGLVNHPNAGGVLVMGLGCENNHIDAFKTAIGEYDPRRVKFFNLQEAEDEVEQGLALLETLVKQVETEKRQRLTADKLVLGFKCGGSDAFSGITANPLLGEIADTLVQLGASAVLTEVPEMFGAETILMNRCINLRVHDKAVSMINEFKAYFLRHGQPVYENPSPGNRAGGITTLEEKSLGCIRKGGRSPVVDVRGYGEQIVTQGLNLLDGPGNDIVSTTALAAAGAQLVLFTTGRGTPLGGPVPTLKVSSNSALFVRKKRWIDFDAGRLLKGETMAALSAELLQSIGDIASGRTQCRNEVMGSRQIAIFKDGVTL